MGTSYPYYGEEKLGLFLDLGSTFSSIAIVLFQWGQVPVVRSVNRYPGGVSSSRTPSQITYDLKERPKAWGLNCSSPSMIQASKANGWTLVSNWKTQMLPIAEAPKSSSNLRATSSFSILDPKKLTKRARPPDRSASTSSLTSPSTTSLASLMIPPSPGQLPGARSITPEQLVVAQSTSEEKDWVIANLPQKQPYKKSSAYQGPMLKVIYADHIKHLVACARAFVSESSQDGDETFMRLWSTCIFVIAHPGNWTSHETELLRESMELAKLLPAAFAPGRLIFVKEPAAIVYFARKHDKEADTKWLKVGASFALCDAAEVGTSVIGYTVMALEPKLKLRAYENMSRLPAGAATVSQAFHTMIIKRLAKTKLKGPEFVTRILDEFETKVKHKFCESAEVYGLKFAADGLTNEQCDVKDGWITIQGSDIEACYKPTVDAILVRLSSIISRAEAKHILLGGGFNESPYVQRRLRETFEAPSVGVSIVIPEIPTHTAVSDGAARFYIAESIGPQPLRFDIGVSSAVDWSSNWEKGMDRPIFTSVSGERFILGKWAPIVTKGSVLDVDATNRKVYNVKYLVGGGPPVLEFQLWAFDPASEPNSEGWMHDLKGRPYESYEVCSLVTADLTQYVQHAPKRRDATRSWVQLEFELLLFHGETSLEAAIAWKDNDVEMRGPASKIDLKFFP